MELVMVERSFELPVSDAELSACAEVGSDGLALRHGWVATDGRHAVHLYAASEAAAVERAQTGGAMPAGQVWAGDWVAPSPRLDTPPAGFSLVVVQRLFPEPISIDMINAVKASAQGCNETYRVTSRDTFRSHGGTQVVCTFFAPDAEAVRTAQRKNDIPFTRAWTARRLA